MIRDIKYKPNKVYEDKTEIINLCSSNITQPAGVYIPLAINVSAIARGRVGMKTLWVAIKDGPDLVVYTSEDMTTWNVLYEYPAKNMLSPATANPKTFLMLVDGSIIVIRDNIVYVLWCKADASMVYGNTQHKIKSLVPDGIGSNEEREILDAKVINNRVYILMSDCLWLMDPNGNLNPHEAYYPLPNMKPTKIATTGNCSEVVLIENTVSVPVFYKLLNEQKDDVWFHPFSMTLPVTVIDAIVNDNTLYVYTKEHVFTANIRKSDIGYYDFCQYDMNVQWMGSIGYYNGAFYTAYYSVTEESAYAGLCVSVDGINFMDLAVIPTISDGSLSFAFTTDDMLIRIGDVAYGLHHTTAFNRYMPIYFDPCLKLDKNDKAVIELPKGVMIDPVLITLEANDGAGIVNYNIEPCSTIDHSVELRVVINDAYHNYSRHEARRFTFKARIIV